MLQPVDKPQTIRPLGPVDVTTLKALVARIAAPAWERLDQGKENAFDVFHHTKHIIFRFTPGNRDAAEFYETPAWTIWAPVLRPVMEQAVAAYGFKDPVFPKAMLARLQAGHVIDRHTDGAGSNLQAHKIHVPLITNPDAIVTVADQDFHLEVGKAYEVNNIAPHGVRNDGAEDRVHFIFEAYDRAG